jgi:hypothetical protein
MFALAPCGVCMRWMPATKEGLPGSRSLGWQSCLWLRKSGGLLRYVRSSSGEGTSVMGQDTAVPKVEKQCLTVYTDSDDLREFARVKGPQERVPPCEVTLLILANR